MGGLASVASVFSHTPGLGLPPLPGNLGLPEKSNPQGTVTSSGRDHDRFVGNSQQAKYKQEFAKAEAYNKAFADILNQQPQLTGEERKQIYDVYSDKFIGKKVENAGLGNLTDFSKTLSPLSPDQYRAQQQQQQQQQQAAPAPAPAPQTVGPVPQPTVEQPQATPTVATPSGNIAGRTATTGVMGTDAAGRGSGKRRGRVSTLLTGLGGAAEQFGA